MIKNRFSRLLRPIRQSRRFIRDEKGAVTVDWVVLTASILLLGMAVGITVGTQATGVGSKIGDTVGEREVSSL